MKIPIHQIGIQPKLYIQTILILALQFTLLSVGNAQSRWNALRDSALFTRQVATMRLMMNSNGILGSTTFPYDSVRKYFNIRLMVDATVPQAGFEYPNRSGNEHLEAGGLWIGAIMNTSEGRKYLVSTAVSGAGGGFVGEMLGHQWYSDSFYHANIYDTHAPTKRFFDDDGDGRIDEDEYDGIDNDGDWNRLVDDLNHNGHPDHGEPHVDEDAGAISESDIYVTYRDSFPRPTIQGHIPLDVRVWQKSFAWNNLIKEPIFPIEYEITNWGYRTLDSVYLGFFAQTFLGTYFPRICCTNVPIARRYVVGFLPGVQTAYSSLSDRNFPNATPFGVTFLGSSKPISSLHFTYRLLNSYASYDDSVKYSLMSSSIIQHDSTLGKITSHPAQLIAVGPFLNFRPGEKLKFAVALVSGERFNVGSNNLQDNAQKALELYYRDYRPPNSPPSPPLRLTSTLNGVILDWKWRQGDRGTNPEEIWDDYNRYIEALPDTHWRKRNPPPGKTHGGRTFEGYKLWRCDSPNYDENAFTLIRQFDVIDDLNFESQTGIQYTYTDSTIVRGRKYWYALTAFTIPDYVVTVDTNSQGNLGLDTINTPPFESSIIENATLYQLPFIPSSKLGEVKVVPNPYRTDRDYTFEFGGWEGLGRLWNEGKRAIWFIHLPPKATIRIFTIMGEAVATLQHDDAQRTTRGLPVGQEEWTLLSESHRAIASGVYVYLVESELGTQTGKFVVIR